MKMLTGRLCEHGAMTYDKDIDIIMFGRGNDPSYSNTFREPAVLKIIENS